MNDNTKRALEALLNALREDEAVVRYDAAKQAYLADGGLITLVNEYNMQGQLLRDEGAKPERDEALIAQITEKLKETYDAILRNERMLAMQDAEQAVSLLVADIDRGIRSVIMPEDVEGGACTGNCSTCGSCR